MHDQDSRDTVSSTERARQLLAQRASLLGSVFVLLKVLVPSLQR